MEQKEDINAFRQIRESLNVSREDVVRRTRSVSVSTVRNVELGRKIRRGTALDLLQAINAYLRDAKQPEITLDVLGLNLH